MTQTERLILENQIAIMNYMNVDSETNRCKMLDWLMKSERHLNESDGDGGH